MTDFSWHETIEAGRRRAELSVQQLWLAYLSFSGIADLVEVEAYLYGLMPLPAYQEEKLAHAVNERLGDLYQATRVLDVKRSAADPATGNPLQVIDELIQKATRARAED